MIYRPDLKMLLKDEVFMMSYIARKINIYHNQLLEPYGITSKQSKLLVFIIKNQENKINQRLIEEEFSLKGSTIATMLTYLEVGGFIRRLPNPEDSRSNLIVVTQKALDIQDVLFSIPLAINKFITNGIQEEEKRQLNELLSKIIKNIDENT